MANDAYRDNVSRLCAQLNIPNPIREEDLTIAGMLFPTPELTHVVVPTDMNRAGRLFLQSRANGVTKLPLRTLKGDAATFFTPALWGDCFPEKRGLIWGIKTADYALITYKQLSA